MPIPAFRLDYAGSDFDYSHGGERDYRRETRATGVKMRARVIDTTADVDLGRVSLRYDLASETWAGGDGAGVMTFHRYCDDFFNRTMQLSAEFGGGVQWQEWYDALLSAAQRDLTAHLPATGR